MYSSSFNVPHDWIDPKYQHVHHSMIVSIFERGRLDLLIAAKLPIETLVERGQFLIVSSISVDFLREIREQTYLITCDGLEQKNPKRFVITQQILTGEGKVAARAAVECCFLINGRSAPPPAGFIESLRQVMG